MKTRQLSSKWTVELVPGEIEMGKDIEKELAKILQEEIDWEVTCNIMTQHGWTKITTSWDVKSLEESYEIKSWCEAHLKGHRKARGKIWLFELEKDASMFAIRWGE